MRRAAAAVAVLFAMGIAAGFIGAATESTGTITACATATAAGTTIGGHTIQDGMTSTIGLIAPVTIPGSTATQCVTATYTNSTVTVTTGGSTTTPTTTMTVPTATTAPTTTAPPPPTCDVTFASGTALGAAVNNTPNGGIGCLHQGSYTGSVTASKAAQTTIRSYPGETATVTGNNDFHGANYTLTSLHFVGSGGGNTIYHGGTNINITYSDITNNNTSNSCLIVGDPGYQPARSTGTIAYNLFHNCGHVDNLQHCEYDKWTQGLVVTHNVYYGCHTYADQLGPDAQGETFSYNTVDGTGSQAGGVLVWGDSSTRFSQGNDVHDNIVAFTPAFAGFHSDWSGGIPPNSSNQVHDNCFFQNLPVDIGTQTGFTATNNITGQNPLFTDRAAHNYALQPGSPCAGKGA